MLKTLAPQRSWRKACAYGVRALRLTCPQCGISPLFPELRRTRTLYDWFAPLDGCPRCGYPYTREQGYYLLAIWAFSYGGAAFVGLSLYLGLEIFANLTTGQLMTAVIIPTALFGIVTARHSKALFLAMDLFFDPAIKLIRKPTLQENDPEEWSSPD